MLEDKSGKIWFGTSAGLSSYDGKMISKISIVQGYSISDKTEVWSIFQDKTGILWFGTSDDLYCYDGKIFRRFLDERIISNKDALTLKWIQCIHEDANGIIWMGSGPIAMEGVIRFDGESLTSSKPNGDGWIRYIIEDKSKNIWFAGRSNGNFIYDGKSFTRFNEKPAIGNVMLADKSGSIWFSGEEKVSSVESTDGIWCYDGKLFTNYSMNNGLSKYFVWSMLQEKNGNIWIGTRNCGLYRYDGKIFTSFSE